ncbi:hypothetical protein SDC49_07175 [Lactobacillus sp. R2/2]|nr:hypothetical protein [Lactobacillus sp. R2/2]
MRATHLIKANLNFNTTDQSAGDVITDLLTDRYNLTGADTGHRAWLLSTRLTSTGIRCGVWYERLPLFCSKSIQSG